MTNGGHPESVTWICRKRVDGEECGHLVIASYRPEPIRWTDGHVCSFEEETPPARPPRFGFREYQVFWNEQGSVACACCHIPYPGSDTWVQERWSEITPETMAEIDREVGHVACERCGKEPRRIATP